MNSTKDRQINPQNAKSNRLMILMFVMLFAAASAMALYLYKDNNTLTESVSQKHEEIKELEGAHVNLQEELVNIEENFDQQIAENEKLSENLAVQLKEVEALKWRVSDARKKLKTSETENANIISRLGRLEVIKAELEQDIAALAVTNSELKMANEKISLDLETSNEYAKNLNENLIEMSEKNSELIARLFTMAPAGFVADNFVVKTERRNDKLTAKAKYTDEVKVSFDLNNVPELYHGEEEIYLVLAKFDGQPVMSVPTKSVSIASKEPITINAADVEKLSLNERQQIDMSVFADKDLDAGTYNLLVYADHGFLGATSFQLR